LIIKSIQDIDFAPDPARRYWSCSRNWNEELIYFSLIDRFADSKERVVGEISSLSNKHYYKNFCGGNLKGITNNLSYLKGLGITAIWISPFYENNSNSYHGYAIQNFLKVDSRFGTLKDLKRLVEEAHKLDMRVILDVIINHTGDNWYYQGDQSPSYSRGRNYQEGGWRFADKPVPTELRNFNYYRKQGQVQNWDAYPETQQGDFFSLKKLKLDESTLGLEVQNILVKIYSYWIKEIDCDGFRLDTVKHAGQLPIARFCDGIKKYCEEIGKKNFFIFGEIPLQYEGIKPYVDDCISLSDKLNYQSLDTALDFPLHFAMADVIKGRKPFSYMKECYLYNKANFPETRLVTFLDNHDQIGAEIKERIGVGLSTNALIGALATLIFFPGIPCIYYGTEQHLSGNGRGDECLRETLFDPEGNSSYLNEKTAVYTALQELIKLRTGLSDYVNAEMFFNKQKTEFDDEKHEDHQEIIVFSRVSNGNQLLILFNQQKIKTHVNVELKFPVSKLSLVYSTTPVELELIRSTLDGELFDLVKVILEPGELLILK
jgi:glycosidase